MKITFVIHQNLCKSDAVKNSILEVFQSDCEVNFLTTKKDSGARDQVAKALNEGADYVILVGGDGTVNEGVNGYMLVPEERRRSAVLGVLPMGTGNDFAKTLKVTKDINELHTLIKNESILEVDLCKMEFHGLHNKTESRYFINISDIGIGGHVVKNVANSSKILGPNLTYVKAIVSAFSQYKRQAIVLKSPEFNWEGEILSLCMANGKYFGSGMCVAPDAKLDDGLMQLTILGGVSLFDYVKNLSRIKKGEKILHKKITYSTARSLSIESKGQECLIDMDGEYVGCTPIAVELLPQTVRMLGREELTQSYKQYSNTV